MHLAICMKGGRRLPGGLLRLDSHRRENFGFDRALQFTTQYFPTVIALATVLMAITHCLPMEDPARTTSTI